MGISTQALTQTLRAALHERLEWQHRVRVLLADSPLLDRLAGAVPCEHGSSPELDPATMMRLLLGVWLGLCEHQRAALLRELHQQSVALARVVHTLEEGEGDLAQAIEGMGVMLDEAYAPSETDRMEAIATVNVIRWLRSLEKHVRQRAYRDFELLGQKGHLRTIGTTEGGVGVCTPVLGV